MDQKEKFTCPACGKAMKAGAKFCTSCGVKLSEFDANIATSEAPPQPQTAAATANNKLIKGWELSPDRFDMYEKMMAMDPIGDPIITSKCVLDSENGLLIVSDDGFAWRIKMGFKQAGIIRAAMSSGKSKWVRWHDVANIIPKKNSQVLVELKIRKNGSLILDKKGNCKIKRWKLTIRQNKGEPKPQWKQRLESYNNIMLEIFNRNKVETDPPTSDSRM